MVCSNQLLILLEESHCLMSVELHLFAQLLVLNYGPFCFLGQSSHQK